MTTNAVIGAHVIAILTCVSAAWSRRTGRGLNPWACVPMVATSLAMVIVNSHEGAWLNVGLSAITAICAGVVIHLELMRRQLVRECAVLESLQELIEIVRGRS